MKLPSQLRRGLDLRMSKFYTCSHVDLLTTLAWSAALHHRTIPCVSVHQVLDISISTIGRTVYEMIITIDPSIASRSGTPHPTWLTATVSHQPKNGATDLPVRIGGEIKPIHMNLIIAWRECIFKMLLSS